MRIWILANVLGLSQVLGCGPYDLECPDPLVYDREAHRCACPPGMRATPDTPEMLCTPMSDGGDGGMDAPIDMPQDPPVEGPSDTPADVRADVPPDIDACTLNTYYRDADGDGRGDPTIPMNACEIPLASSSRAMIATTIAWHAIPEAPKCAKERSTKTAQPVSTTVAVAPTV